MTEMTPEQLKNIIEAALLAAGRPLSLKQLEGLFSDLDCPSRDEFRAALAQLEEDYAPRGLELKEVASGYRIQATSAMQPWLARLSEERPPKYSRALLETLALIAYRQPITRGEIEDIRGVSVSTSIIKTLEERNWARVVGHRDVPGRPAMYATTREFLDYFNLKGLGELPTLAELRDIDSINAELDLDPDAPPMAANDEDSSTDEEDADVIVARFTTESDEPEAAVNDDTVAVVTDTPVDEDDVTLH